MYMLAIGQVVTKGVHLLLIEAKRTPLDLSTHWYMRQDNVMQSLSGFIHFGFLGSSPYPSLPYSLSNVLQSLKNSHLIYKFKLFITFTWISSVL